VVDLIGDMDERWHGIRADFLRLRESGVRASAPETAF
jgi:hypothetical protein